jgi:hypothetical protein
MKTHLDNFRRSRRDRGGSAVVALLAMLSAMVILLAANTGALNRLNRELKGIEKHQIERLDPAAKGQTRWSQTVTNQLPEK